MMEKMQKKYICPCCGYRTLDSEREYDICPVCFWEDDWLQYKEETFAGGANKVSLLQARENYKKFGACEEQLIQYVRQPLEEEVVKEDEDETDEQ